MRVYISVDMEGISGICCPEHVLPDGRLYAIGQRLMTADASAAVRGAFDGGADEVIVADTHGGSGNILPESLDPRAYLLAGAPHQPLLPFLDSETDGLILLGYHAMAGTKFANLEHTMSSKTWFKFRLNGVEMGEMGMDALIAAECGVPVVMVSGDDKLCQEAKDMLPTVETACVKIGLGRQSALCLSPERGQERVYRAALNAVRRLKDTHPGFTIPEIPSPARVALTYKMTPDADAANVFGTKRLDGYTVETTYNRLSEMYGGIWADYGAAKIADWLGDPSK